MRRQRYVCRFRTAKKIALGYLRFVIVWVLTRQSFLLTGVK